jgi:thioesterase domain-containing protein
VRRAAWPHVTVFREGGSRPPLLLVSGLQGHPLVFRELAQSFEDEQPVLGLQLVGVDAEEELDVHAVEDMAAVLEPQVVAACPEGPVIVGGFSMGALVAFELARRLRARGRDVPLLISVDGCAPRFYRQKIPRLRRAVAHARAFAQKPLPYVSARLQNFVVRLSRHVGQDWRFMVAADLGDPERQIRLMKMMVLWEQAAVRYDPHVTLPVPLLLVRTSESFLPLGVEDDGALGWAAFVSGGISALVVPGRHTTFLHSAPNRRVVADAISRRIAEVGTSNRVEAPR